MALVALLEAAGAGSVLPFIQLATDPSVIHSNSVLAWVYVGLGFSSDTQFIVFAAIIVLLVIVAAHLALGLSQWFQVRFVWDLVHNLSVRLMRGYSRKPYTFFLERNSAELNRNVVVEMTRLSNGVYQPALQIVSRMVIGVTLVAVLLVVQPLLTLLLASVIGLPYIVISMLAKSHLRRTGEETTSANKERVKSSSELFGAIKEAQLRGNADYFLGRFNKASIVYSRNNKSQLTIAQMPARAIFPLAFAGIIGLFIVLLLTGEPLRAIIPVIGFLAYAGSRLNPAFSGLYGALSTYRYHQNLVGVLGKELRDADQKGPTEFTEPMEQAALRFESEIRLDNVSFRYPGNREMVLKDISIAIPKNSSVALVGSTGGGKTTTLDVVLGLLTPTNGDVLVDGVKVQGSNMSSWQAKIGYVPQEIFLSDDTIRRNIVFGVPDQDINEEAVVRAAEMARIHEFISKDLPLGYNTLVGERGVRLSGGQRQRIGIARALYWDPELLVFDEATSDIDNVTEAMISQAISQLSGRKTLLFVAHRLSTVRNFDLLYMMDKGTVVASGTYGALLKDSLPFRMLVEGIADASNEAQGSSTS
ncbi:MAG: ABC-type multidrug transport system, ATPase and permease component [Chloroflexi bacterium]|nr:MAG: ABC-type multidrug transport system, ATPase and permease component [Chloroflexota bacterium]